MAGLVTVTRKTETIQAYQLTSEDDMLAALKYIAAGGYTGSLALSTTNGTDQVWRLQIQNSTKNVSQFAAITDYIVIENNAIASVVPATQFTNMYQTA